MTQLGVTDATQYGGRLAAAKAASRPAQALPSGEVSAAYLAAKRAFDLVSALVGIVVCGPLLAGIAAAIKLDSPGPVLFRQRRPGRNGKPFTLLKFRTMTCDAEEKLPEVLPLNREPDHSLIRIPDDPRVTRLGRFLRRSSLDELPQLVNILRGEMSLVGPRPISRPIADERATLRLVAPPGLTGLWQINGRKETDCRFMLEKDMEYLSRRSLWFDLGILMRTVPAVLRRNGA
ncbi:MAG: sugar transferase, partial [Armatimonadota bacterium]